MFGVEYLPIFSERVKVPRIVSNTVASKDSVGGSEQTFRVRIGSIKTGIDHVIVGISPALHGPVAPKI